MDDTLFNFRCPNELKDCLDELQETTQINRSSIITAAIRQLNKEVQRRKGRLIPAYPTTARPTRCKRKKKQAQI